MMMVGSRLADYDLELTVFPLFSSSSLVGCVLVLLLQQPQPHRWDSGGWDGLDGVAFLRRTL